MKTLTDWGFTVNLYDWCIENKMIEVKQCPVVWHVDDIKISHVSKDFITRIINDLLEKYGKEASLTIIKKEKIH